MLGKASEIKTFLIESECLALSDCINQWLGCRPEVSVISIQYQMSFDHGDGSYRPQIVQNALIIYREGEA